MKRLVVIVVLAFALVGCSSPPNAGKVIEHRYDDPDEWMQCVSVGIAGKPGYNPCGYQMWHHEPERFLLYIDDGEKRGNVSVPEHVWHSVRNGDWYDVKAGRTIPR